MNPDALLRLRFATTEEGGRTTDVKGVTYACSLLAGGFAFDCRLLLNDLVLELGTTYCVAVRFLDSKTAIAKLTAGDEVALWEGRVVGSAEILTIYRTAGPNEMNSDLARID